jgi:hypothetical protein
VTLPNKVAPAWLTASYPSQCVRGHVIEVTSGQIGHDNVSGVTSLL